MHTKDNSTPAMDHQDLKLKSDLHISRKIWHCLGISSMAAFYLYFGHFKAWVALLTLMALALPFDIFRQRHPQLNKFAIRMFGPLMRKSESHSLSGTTYLLMGTFVLLLFRDKHLIVLTLLFLAFGDPFASFFGVRFGKDRILNNKTLQGTLAAFAVCTTVSALYFYATNIMTERLLIVAPISGLIGALSELIPIGKLDDNLTFPIIAASLLWVLFKVYGGV